MKELLKSFGGVDKLIKLVLVIVFCITVFFAIKKLLLWYKRRNAGTQVVDGTQLDPAKNYDSYALAVHTAFDNWVNDADEMNNVAKTLLPLNNDELKQVNNRYLSLYGEGDRTLYTALNDYWFCVPCTELNALLERVKSIGIL